MKNYNKDCKIIQDLLPTYVVNLTSEETNQYIEEHTSTCEECKKKLTNMQGELEVDKIDKNTEIKGLRKVKIRLRLQILLTIIIVVGLCSMGIYINNNYSIYRNETGKILIKRSNIKITVSNSKYLVIRAKKLREETKDGYIYITHIATINEENKCTNMRYIEDGYTRKKLEELYEAFKYNEDQKIFTNIEIKEEKLYYNANDNNGRDKDEIIKEIENYYDEIEYIKEI